MSVLECLPAYFISFLKTFYPDSGPQISGTQVTFNKIKILRSNVMIMVFVRDLVDQDETLVVQDVIVVHTKVVAIALILISGNAVVYVASVLTDIIKVDVEEYEKDLTYK